MNSTRPWKTVESDTKHHSSHKKTAPLPSGAAGSHRKAPHELPEFAAEYRVLKSWKKYG